MEDNQLTEDINGEFTYGHNINKVNNLCSDCELPLKDKDICKTCKYKK